MEYSEGDKLVHPSYASPWLQQEAYGSISNHTPSHHSHTEAYRPESFQTSIFAPYDATFGILRDTAPLGNPAEQEPQLSDPARAIAESRVTRLLPGASLRHLDEVISFLEKQQGSAHVASGAIRDPNVAWNDTQSSQHFETPPQQMVPPNKHGIIPPNALSHTTVMSSRTSRPLAGSQTSEYVSLEKFAADAVHFKSVIKRSSRTKSQGQKSHNFRASEPAWKNTHPLEMGFPEYRSDPLPGGVAHLANFQASHNTTLLPNDGESYDSSEFLSSSQYLGSGQSTTAMTAENDSKPSEGISQATISSTPRFECTFPLCDKTFARRADVLRHQKTVHGGSKYTCLLCVCNLFCATPCAFTEHKKPYQDSRLDKMRSHLLSKHGELWAQAEIPAAWLNTYVQVPLLGWYCGQCLGHLGFWETDQVAITNHACPLSTEPQQGGGGNVLELFKPSASGVQSDLKRSSLETMDKLKSAIGAIQKSSEPILDGKVMHGKGPNAEGAWG